MIKIAFTALAALLASAPAGAVNYLLEFEYEAAGYDPYAGLFRLVTYGPITLEAGDVAIFRFTAADDVAIAETSGVSFTSNIVPTFRQPASGSSARLIAPNGARFGFSPPDVCACLTASVVQFPLRPFVGAEFTFVFTNETPVTFFRGGFGINRVPEPATWAMMIAGFALTGVSFRRQQIALAR